MPLPSSEPGSPTARTRSTSHLPAVRQGNRPRSSRRPSPRRMPSCFRACFVASTLACLALALSCPPVHAASKTRSEPESKPESKAKPRASARILKVLPHFLDKQGRHTVNPSLFDRDAYQFDLRHSPELRSGMRIDVLWKGLRGTPSAVLNLKVEMRGSKAPAQAPIVLQQRVFASSDFSQWTRIPVVGEQYEGLGELVSWRVSLWRDDELVAEQTSFLW